MKAHFTLSKTRRQSGVVHISFLIALMLCLGIGRQAWGQTTAEIGDGTLSFYIPLPGWYGWQYEVYLYTPSAASFLDDGCTISSIAFNVSSNSTYTGSQMTIWVKDVDASYALSSSTTFDNYISGATQVYTTDELTSIAGWNTFNFSTSFNHTAGKALLVAVRGIGCSTYGGCARQCYYTSVSGTHWYKRQDYSDPGTSVSGNIDDYRSNVQITYTVEPPYCTPTLSSTTTTYYISNFTTIGGITNINNTTTGAGHSYSNFYNSHSASAYVDSTINFNITIAGYSTYGSAIWVDWNRDGDFNDTGEKVYNTTSYTASPHSGSFTIPSNASSGDYHMRVVSDYYNSNPSNPCSGNTGEFEDYKLTVFIPTCPAPTNLTATATEHDATVTWTAGNSESSWILEYSTNSDFSNATSEITTNNTKNFTCLPTGVMYYVRVKADCGGGDESSWATTTFTTSGPTICNTVGTATNSSYLYGPFNDFYNYSYNQIIYPASSIGSDGVITAIAFQYAYSSPMTAKDNVSIYMGHTPNSSFSSGSDWISTNNMQLVYSGPLNCTTSGWNTFTLDSPFNYNGTDNLVLTIHDNSGGYDGSSYKFYYSTSTENVQLYLYQDSYPYTANNPGTGNITSYYPNTQFCMITSSCQMPVDLTSVPDSRTATISWTEAGEATEWQICFNGDENNLIDVTTTTYTFTGLTPETQYNVKVRSVCSECDMSTWTSLNFTTLESCPAPTNLTASNVTGTTADLSWTGDAESYNVTYSNNNQSITTNVTGSSYVLCGLDAGTTYNVQVQADCGEEDGMSRWTTPITFTTTNAPDNFSAGSITEGLYVPCGDFTEQSINSNETTIETPTTGSITIGDGTYTTSSVPFYSLYDMSFVEQIYTAAEIGTAATINSVSFHHDGANSGTYSVILYMKNVSRTSFANTSDYEPVTASDIVYNGTLTLTNTDSWVTINLTTPFEYNGTSNLMIAMDENTDDDWSSRYFYYTTTTNSVLYYYSDTYNADPYNLDSYSGSISTSSSRANIKLGISYTATVTAGSATGNNVEFQWKRDNEPIVGANSETYTITIAEMESLSADIHTYTRWVMDACNDWTTSEGEYIIDLRMPSTPTVAAPSNLYCGDRATLNISSNTSSNIPVMYLWYDELPSPNISPIAHSGNTYTTAPLNTGSNTLYVTEVTYRTEGADTIWQCQSAPYTVTLVAEPFTAPEIQTPNPQYCGTYFSITPTGNSNPNHTYIWYSDPACTQQVGQGFTCQLPRQLRDTTYYLREYAVELENGYLCASSNTPSVSIEVIQIESPGFDYTELELCKGEPLNLVAYGEVYDEDLETVIVWYGSETGTEILDTSANMTRWSRYLADTSTTLYAAAATNLISYNGPIAMTTATATGELYGNAVYFDLETGDTRIELDSINLQVRSEQGTGHSVLVYYRNGSCQGHTTDANSWTRLEATMDYSNGEHAIVHLAEPLELLPHDNVSIMINTGFSFQLYYNHEAGVSAGSTLCSNNFLTVKSGYGFQYTADFQSGFPSTTAAERTICGDIHYTVAGELVFGCMSQREPVEIIVDSLPSIAPLSEPDALCTGATLSESTLNSLKPAISYNTHSADTTSAWMVSINGNDTVALTADATFTYGNTYTLVHRVTNNCGSKESTAAVTVIGDPSFTENIDLPEYLCANNEIVASLPSSVSGGDNVAAHWEYSTVDEENYTTLDLTTGIPAIGQYYIRAYIENSCNSSTSNIEMVEVRDLPTFTPLAEELAVCYGQPINPEVPQVDNNLSAITEQGWMLLTDNGLVATTFPQTALPEWDGKRICYAATNDCGTTYSDTITLIVHPDINVQASTSSIDICPAIGVTLTATSDVENTTYEWSNDDEGGLVETTGSEVTARRGSVDTYHTYTVIATDEFGCHDTTTTVEVLFRDIITDVEIDICGAELPYTYSDGRTDTVLTRAGNHIVYFPQPNGCDSVVNLTLNVRQYRIVDTHYGLCGAGDSYTWDINGQTYTEAARDTVRVPYTTGYPCDSVLYCLTITQGEPYLTVTDPQITAATGEQISTTVFGRTECEQTTAKVAIEFSVFKDGVAINPEDYGTLNISTAIPALNLQFGRNIRNSSGQIPGTTFNMYNYQYDYFYLNFFHTAPNTVTATWNEPGEYKIVFRVVNRTGGMDYAYQSEPGVLIGGAGSRTTTVISTDSLVMNINGTGGNEGQDADVNPGENGMIVINPTQYTPVIGATSTFSVDINNSSLPEDMKVALDYEVYRDGELLNTLDGYGTLNFATYYDGTHSMVGRDLEEPDGSIPSASFRVLYYSYGYFHLGFFAQANSQLSATWQQPGEYKMVFRLKERTNGDPYPLTYGSSNALVGGGNGTSTNNVLDTSAITFYIPVAEPAEVDLDTTVCENDLPVMIHGTEFDDDAVTDLHVTSDNGVYDTIYHLTLTIAPSYSIDVDSVVCAGALPIEWNGVTFTEEGTQQVTLQSSLGCDSVVTMTVSIDQTVAMAYTETACGSFEWNGNTYTTSGDYTYDYENDYGCTITDTLHLTIYEVTPNVATETACGSFEWNGGTYTASGDYTYEYENDYGCTVTDTLHLTIYEITPNVTTDTACGSFEWNGTTYTTSGDYTYEYENNNGCTVTDTLHLTINNPQNFAETAEACGEYFWQLNGQTYTASDTYFYIHEDENGCEQVDTLYLTINNATNTAETVVACGSHEWNGETYTASGTYLYTHDDNNGCEQVDTLYLTVNHPANTAETVVACGEFVWDLNGQTYTASDTYYYTHEDDNGCEQVDTLYLTINPVYNTEDAVEISVTDLPYMYEGTLFDLGTQSGSYTINLQSELGCDSIVTLQLTVNDNNSGNAFLNTTQIDENTFEITAFANQSDPDSKVSIAYSITKDGVPVNLIEQDCGGGLYIGTDYNGNIIGQDIYYGEGQIPGNTFMISPHYHDYFYFHFLNGRTNRFTHTFTESGAYEVTFSLMNRRGGRDIMVPYFYQGSMRYIGGESSTEGTVITTATITFEVSSRGNSNSASGISDLSQDDTFVLFPNPANDFVTLRTSMGQATCTVTDMNGKVILTTEASASEDLRINVANWAAGVYFVNMQHDGTVTSKKLVITK